MKLLRFLLHAARDGRQKLSTEARREVASFVDSQRHASGGYVIPRSGTPDLYYTLFGASSAAVFGGIRHLRVLRSYLASVNPAESDLAHAAALAVLRRMTLRRRPPIRVADFLAEDGGFTHISEHAATGTPYGAYLGLILCEALRTKYPEASVAASLRSCSTQDGGLANTTGQPVGITTATAAGIMIAACCDVDLPVGRFRSFLLDRAADDGGIHSWADGTPDLLSTATALCALKASGGIPADLRTPQARFVQHCWSDSGGFREAPDQGTPDVEYTFYALLALGCL